MVDLGILQLSVEHFFVAYGVGMLVLGIGLTALLRDRLTWSLSLTLVFWFAGTLFWPISAVSFPIIWWVQRLDKKREG